MINFKTLVICIVSIFVLSGGNFISKADVFAQEEADVYLQLSNILDNIKKDLDDVIQSINSGQKDNALILYLILLQILKKLRRD